MIGPITSMLSLHDEVHRTQHLLEGAFMACADIGDRGQSAAVRTFLQVVIDHLEEIENALERLRSEGRAS